MFNLNFCLSKLIKVGTKIATNNRNIYSNLIVNQSTNVNLKEQLSNTLNYLIKSQAIKFI